MIVQLMSVMTVKLKSLSGRTGVAGEGNNSGQVVDKIPAAF